MRERIFTNAPRVIEMHGVTAVAMKDPDEAVIEGINWSVDAGEYWVLAGLQGSGKSDFLMMAGGLLAPGEGEYRLFGETMPIPEGENLAKRLRIGLVFEGGQLFNQLTIAENVALPLRYHRNLPAADAVEQTRITLEAMDLISVADAAPSALSRNMHRRAGLARALALQPEVLLLDGPLSGLDPRHEAWWIDILDQLSAGHSLCGGRPMTLVATTASLRPWQGHAKRFALLKDRRFEDLGDWSKVESSSEPAVHELLALRTNLVERHSPEEDRVSETE